MEEVDREISEMKLSLNDRARIVAESYLTAVRSAHLLLSFLIIIIKKTDLFVCSSIHNLIMFPRGIHGSVALTLAPCLPVKV